jgi:hypothetical protein
VRLDFCSVLPTPWCMWLNVLGATGAVAAFVALCVLLYEAWIEGGPRGDDDG